MEYRLAENIDKLPLFFVISRPRSGSTLLRTLLDANKNIAIPMECPLIITLYKKYKGINDWDSDFAKGFVEDLRNQWKIDNWYVDFDQIEESIKEYKGPKSFQVLYKLISLNYKTVFNKQVIQIIGDKNPAYNIYINKIAKIFPEAKFIHLIRDFRDNIVSVRNYDFESPFVSLLAYRWKHINRKASLLKSKHPDKWHFVRYEDLVSSPESVISSLCEFINISYDSEMLSFYQKKDEILANFNKEEFEKYFANLFEPISSNSVGKWKTELTQKQIKTAEIIVGSTSEKFSYERSNKRFNIWIHIRSLPAVLYGFTWIQSRYLYDSLPFRLRRMIYYPNFMATLYYKISKGRKR